MAVKNANVLETMHEQIAYLEVYFEKPLDAYMTLSIRVTKACK